MSHLFTPELHLWTNKKRFKTFYNCISPESKVIFGCNIPEVLIRKYYKGDFWRVNYIDKEGADFRIDNRSIYGHFRTAGVLAIAVAYALGAEDIYIAGMDGYTLYDEKSLNKKSKSHHCYGHGYTDDATWKECVIKDRLVYAALKKLKKNINFSIITPTKFSEFYIKL